MQFSGASRGPPSKYRPRSDSSSDDEGGGGNSIDMDNDEGKLDDLHSMMTENARRNEDMFKKLPKEVDLNLHEEDDEDVRLEHNRRKLIADELRELKKRGGRDKKVMEVYADSPNGYRIVAEQPAVTDSYTFDLAVKHYSFHLRHFLPLDFPDEYGLCHYNLGKLFMVARREETMAGGSMSGPLAEKRVRNIEHAIFHFRAALRVFTFYSHPMMHAIIATMIGQLFRERFVLYEHRYFVAKRNISGEGLQNGIDQLLEGLPAFAQAPTLSLEFSICCLEIAYLYYLMLKPKDYPSKDEVPDDEQPSVRDLVVSNLERSFSLTAMLRQAARGELKSTRVVPPRTWDIFDTKSHPAHVSILLTGRPLQYLEGLGYYLLGLTYMIWSPELHYQEKAFENLSRCMKNKYLPQDSEQWMDAHFRTAEIITKCPLVVESDWTQASDSDLYLQSAIRHLDMALKYPALAGRRRMEVTFALSQAHISRLYLITDRVPYGSSLTQAIVDRDGIEILQSAENFLKESTVHVTAANSQSIFDAYIFFFSRLKFAEFRMLENACSPSLTPEQRMELLRSSVINLVDALRARTEADNLDLHLIAIVHMAHILLSSRKYVPAMKAYSKALMTLSALSTRHLFSSPIVIGVKKTAAMTDKLVTQSLIALSKESTFVKSHLGPLSNALVETGVGIPGVAYWSLEREDKWGDNVLLAAAQAGKGSPSPRERHSSKSSGRKGRSSSPQPEGTERPLPPSLPPPESIAIGSRGDPPSLVGRASAAEGWGSPLVPPLDLSEPVRPEGAPPLSAFANGAVGLDVDNRSIYRRRRRRRVPTVIEINKFLEETRVAKKRSEQRLVEEEASGKSHFLLPSHEQTKHFRRGAESGGAVSGGRSSGSGTGAQAGRAGLLPRVDSKKKSLFSAITNFFKKDPTAALRDDTRYVKFVKNTAHLWGSNQCLYALMTMSRASRIAMVLRARGLVVMDGERAAAALRAVPRSVRDEVARLSRQLVSACKVLVEMPMSVKELSHRSDEDLRVIFNNYPQVHRLLHDIESVLEDRVAGEDFFVPLVYAAPSLNRSREAYDKSLLFANTLLQGMRSEAQGKAVERASNKRKGVSSSGSPKSPSKKDRGPPSAAAAEEEELRPSFQQELDEGHRQGKMTYELCQILDGSLHGDIREVFTQYLQPDECIINFHLPSQASQKMQAVLVWRESQSAFPSAGKESEHERVERIKKMDVVMEYALGDMEAAKVTSYINAYLDALHCYPTARRQAEVSDALKSLSLVLGLSEMAIMMPDYIRSLVICCPPAMRLLPWHAMLLELPRDKKEKIKFTPGGGIDNSQTKVVHLLDRYCMRLGPTLSLFELSCRTAKKLKNAIGMYKLCAVDGEDDEHSNTGLRSTEMEVGCVTTTFSGDPSDFDIFAKELAAPELLRTSELRKESNVAKMRRRKARLQRRLQQEEEGEPVSSDDEYSSEDLADDDDIARIRKAFGMCRVLHWGANKIPLDSNAVSAAVYQPKSVNAKKRSALRDVRLHKRSTRASKQREEEEEEAVAEARDDVAFSSQLMVAQLHLRNCALAVFSRFGAADDVSSSSDLARLDANMEFLESAVLAGAATVMYPLWSALSQGGNAVIGLQLFLIRFYTELPLAAKSPRAIAEACRRTQLWLRAVTGQEVVDFVNKAPLPHDSRARLVAEMEDYFMAARVMVQEEGVERLPAPDRRYFDHVLFWGSFCVSGHGGGVHPPDIVDGDPDEELRRGNIGGAGFADDPELDNIQLEAKVLRREGKYAEARELELVIRGMTVNRLKKKYNSYKKRTIEAGRRVLDKLEVLDKSVLDEDEDSIEVSDEEAVAGTPGARRRMSIAAKKGAAAKQQQQEEAAKAAAGPKPSPGGSKLVRMASTYGINTARLDDLDDDEAKDRSRPKRLAPITRKSQVQVQVRRLGTFDKDEDEDDGFDSDDSDDALHRTLAGLLGRDAARRTLRLKMGVMREVGVIKRDVRSYDEASEQAKELLKEAAEQARENARVLADLARENARKLAADGAVYAARGVARGIDASQRVLALGRDELRKRGLVVNKAAALGDQEAAAAGEAGDATSSAACVLC